MKIGSAFPSDYIKASDLPPGTLVPLTISNITIETLGQGREAEQKPVLHFVGKSKGLVLNKTNANSITVAYGDETDHWIGKRLLIYADRTQFGADMVDCVRVKVPTTPTTSPAPQPPSQPPMQTLRTQAAQPVAQPFGDEQQFKDDDIPF